MTNNSSIDYDGKVNHSRSVQKAVSDLPSEQRELISDGYHSFKELYDHRIELFIALCRKESQINLEHDVNNTWRTLLHSDGTVFEGWFVLGIAYSEGRQITYHLPIARWNDCEFATELERAPHFDGHTSADVLERLKNL